MEYALTHELVKGDTLRPFGVQLKRSGSAVDVTGLTVEFKMVNSADDSVKVNWAAATIDDATAGKVSYDFAAGDVDTAGTFWAWFRIASGSEYETFPAAGPDGKARSLKVIINDAA